MTYDEFWYGDPCILSAAQKAYMRDKSYTAWLYGQYNEIAYSVVMANAFAKKGKPRVEYPKWKDPIPRPSIKKETKETREKKFRQSQANQNSWLHYELQKK